MHLRIEALAALAVLFSALLARIAMRPTTPSRSRWMRDAITAAGLPLKCQPHGLRKAAGRRLAEGGATTKQIMANLGHKDIAEAERYTREASQPRLADAGMALVPSRLPLSQNSAQTSLGNDEKYKDSNML